MTPAQRLTLAFNIAAMAILGSHLATKGDFSGMTVCALVCISLLLVVAVDSWEANHA